MPDMNFTAAMTTGSSIFSLHLQSTPICTSQGCQLLLTHCCDSSGCTVTPQSRAMWPWDVRMCRPESPAMQHNATSQGVGAGRTQQLLYCPQGVGWGQAEHNSYCTVHREWGWGQAAHNGYCTVQRNWLFSCHLCKFHFYNYTFTIRTVPCVYVCVCCVCCLTTLPSANIMSHRW